LRQRLSGPVLVISPSFQNGEAVSGIHSLVKPMNDVAGDWIPDISLREILE
jgi:hypothetical protein